jgi:6-phosphofructokinase 2
MTVPTRTVHRERAAIVTVTLNPALDVWASTTLVEPERKLHCTASELTPGGGGINVARAIHSLGGEALALFPTGGSSGELLCDLLLGEGVSIHAVAVAGMTRESFVIRETATGQHYRFVLPGPMLMSHELAACLHALDGLLSTSAIVVLSGSLPEGVHQDRLGEVVAAVRARGAVVIVDTSGPALDAAAHAGALLLKPSLNELRRHSGDPLSTDDEIERAAHDLLSLGPNHAVMVSLGAKGAMLAAVDAPTVRIEAPMVPVVSAVGAGDSLVGAMAMALAEGADLVEAARRGVAAGTAATLSSDHKLCRLEDVERLLPLVHTRPLARPLTRRSA